MPRYLKINIICLLFLVFTVPASSELYQYVDENGIMRLTDNIYSVPVDSRAQLEQFSEFEGISDELAILPIQDKPVSQVEKHPKPEKTASPKTSKEITPVAAEAQKRILPPDTEKKIASESKEKASDLRQPIVSDKTIPESEIGTSHPELYKSNKITVIRSDRKETSQKKAVKPVKSTKKDLQPKIISKDQVQTITAEKSVQMPKSKSKTENLMQSQDHADSNNTPIAAKSSEITPDKDIPKKAVPVTTAKPVIIREKLPETTNEIATHTEKRAEKESSPKPASKQIAKQETKTKKNIIDKQATASPTFQTKLPQKIIAKTTTPDVAPQNVTQKTVPAIKTEPRIVKKELDDNISIQKTATKPDPKEKTYTETKKLESGISEELAEVQSEPKTASATLVNKEIKAEKVIIDKKPVTPLSAQAELPQQSIVKPSTPDVTQKTTPEIKTETKVVTKEQNENISSRKTAAKPDSKEKTYTETKKLESGIPEELAEVQSEPKTASATVVNKEIKAEKVIIDKKPVTPLSAQAELPRQSIVKPTTPDVTQKTVPAIKTEPRIVEKEPDDDIPIQKTAAKPDSKEKTYTETNKLESGVPQKETGIELAQKSGNLLNDKKETKSQVIITDNKTSETQKNIPEPSKNILKNDDTQDIKTDAALRTNQPNIDEPDNPPAKKSSDPLIITNQADPVQLAAAQQTTPDTRKMTSKESKSIKNAEQSENTKIKTKKNHSIETDTIKVNQKDESLILAKLESTRKVLSNKKEALNKKFIRLMEEKQEIENSVDEDDEKSVLAYNENVKKLNIKIKQYKTEKKYLQAEIEKYNRSIRHADLN